MRSYIWEAIAFEIQDKLKRKTDHKKKNKNSKKKEMNIGNIIPTI